MLIAKLSVAINNAGIEYNSNTELGTDKTRGAVLPNGSVVRGLGTHFADQAAKERYERLTKEANAIRDKFSRQFMRTPIEGTFILPIKGQGKFFAERLSTDPDVAVSVVEFELSSAGEGLNPRELSEWGDRVKNQLLRIPLGRGKDADDEGLSAIETLADCPAMSPTTSRVIKDLLSRVRNKLLSRQDFKCALENLKVEMESSALR